ncbi:hypothetical protein EDD16DRAFT_1571629 [Pisolithus croceorrhizus]|nr:hypothetical protein EDD16DRAFT_1571629 [Pisolithus croceorrhizus]
MLWYSIIVAWIYVQSSSATSHLLARIRTWSERILHPKVANALDPNGPTECGISLLLYATVFPFLVSALSKFAEGSSSTPTIVRWCHKLAKTRG